MKVVAWNLSAADRIQLVRLLRLYLLEIWQQIVPAPSRVSKFDPRIVIQFGSSIEKHGIDYGAPADY